MELLARQELGRPVFPADFPDTAAGQSFLKMRAARLVDKWVAHPIAKRTPYFMGDGSPFFPAAPLAIAASPCLHWSQGVASRLVVVSIQMVGRGSVRPNASIYSRELSEEELNSLEVLDSADAAQRNEAALQHWAGAGAAVDDDAGTAEPVRIGVAFGGGVSMLRGIGFGVGFVDWSAIAASSKGRVWIRNLNSTHCYAAIAKPIGKW